VKNNQDNQIQNITVRNKYFTKKCNIRCTMASAPKAGYFSRIFLR